MSTIAERFLFLRTLSGLTQHQFASSIHLSQGRLSDIEKGKNNPSIDTIISVLQNYSVPSDWLLLGIGSAPLVLAKECPQPSPDTPLPPSQASEEEVLVLNIFSTLAKKQQEHVLSYLRFLSSQYGNQLPGRNQ